MRYFRLRATWTARAIINPPTTGSAKNILCENRILTRVRGKRSLAGKAVMVLLSGEIHWESELCVYNVLHTYCVHVNKQALELGVTLSVHRSVQVPVTWAPSSLPPHSDKSPS